MRLFRKVVSALVAAYAVVMVPYAHAANLIGKEGYVPEPLPPGFQVTISEFEGPVFADANGRTLYKWPKKGLRNGDAGEVQGKPTCGNKPVTENSGFLSPYPGGLEMPGVDTNTRAACTDVWPVVFAPADAKPVGKWTVVSRLDGRNQWAYDGWPMYSSALDKRPGDVNGGSAIMVVGEAGALRHPVSPQPNVPSQFGVETSMFGRLVVLRDGWSVYTFDGDGRNKSNCTDTCLKEWTPILAPASAGPIADWTILERDPGILQWAFRGRPLYRHLGDSKIGALDGSDVPRWHNVYTQMTPPPPAGFAMKNTIVGLVLGDANGKTVYRYNCADDAVDQLACDNPESPQLYRFAVCGGGDPDRCAKAFPYVIAPTGTKSGNQLWGTMYINPKTGKSSAPDAPGALNVWTFRSRPVYTFAGSKNYGDRKPSDINANGWGEVNGARNGYFAMIYRDIYESRDGGRGGF